ncbi:hypothetical protein CLV72_10484 [Allonocardiopsis opalescens]|uniref:Lon N-terminal domain-containing protein n=2 Tax=Allonocardiopsis opalescens TaxID=1144618 RepID=A0A2T0Q3Y4_9ACTN|nr:hypothetical protein CLV72_10484 [Allonocardiopsis opalescens]
MPLFPLGTVLFPGMVVTLSIFEERYRRLVADLLEEPEDADRGFGVVAIRLGREVGSGTPHRMASVGCVAELQRAQHHDDGRYTLTVSGGSRFRTDELFEPDDPDGYLRASVTVLPDAVGDNADALAEVVARRFKRYGERLAAAGIAAVASVELPSDPLRLSYAVAGALLVDPGDKQRLLQAEHAAARLADEAELLAGESRLLKSLRTLPAGQFLDTGVSLN